MHVLFYPKDALYAIKSLHPYLHIKNHARKMTEYRSLLKRKESEADMKNIA